MTLKSEVKESTKSVKQKYPRLMICKEPSGLIILATSENENALEGFVVFSDMYYLGQFSNGWNRKEFVPFYGSITLTEE